MATELKWGYVDNDNVDQLAIAGMLNTVISLTPESDLYGTEACRAIIVTQSGRLRGSNYKGRLPLTVDIAKKVGRYMGGLDGVWKQMYAFDQSPNNQITDFYDIDKRWQTTEQYEKMYDVGVVWAQSYNTRMMFYPMFQTVYKDSTSVLNSLPTIIACCQINKFMFRAHTNITGGQYTEAQVIERNNRYITQQAEGKFHNRYEITPETYITGHDRVLGYAYHSDVTIKAGMMVTVGQFTVTASRIPTQPAA